MTRRLVQYSCLLLLVAAAVVGSYYASNRPTTNGKEAPQPLSTKRTGSEAGPAVLEEPNQPVAAEAITHSRPVESSPSSTASPERLSADVLQRKYAHATEGEIKFAHESLSKDLHKLMDEYLAEEIRRGHYELVELPKGQDLSPATSRTESFRVESFPDDSKGVTAYKIARCEPQKLPEASDYVLELKWLAQEIDSRKLRDH